VGVGARGVLTEIRVCEARVNHEPKLDKALTHGLYAVKKSMQPSEMGGRQRSCLYIFRLACCENKTPAHGVDE
jgi:hypothetical protein